MASLATIATVISATSTVVGGAMQASAMRDEAAQLDAKGQEELAASQRKAEARREEGRLLTSRQQALAAASGAGAGVDAPSIMQLMGETSKQAEFNAQSELFGGESRKLGLKRAADNKRREASATLLGSVLSGAGRLAGGFG